MGESCSDCGGSGRVSRVGMRDLPCGSCRGTGTRSKWQPAPPDATGEMVEWNGILLYPEEVEEVRRRSAVKKDMPTTEEHITHLHFQFSPDVERAARSLARDEENGDDDSCDYRLCERPGMWRSDPDYPDAPNHPGIFLCDRHAPTEAEHDAQPKAIVESLLSTIEVLRDNPGHLPPKDAECEHCLQRIVDARRYLGVVVTEHDDVPSGGPEEQGGVPYHERSEGAGGTPEAPTSSAHPSEETKRDDDNSVYFKSGWFAGYKQAQEDAGAQESVNGPGDVELPPVYPPGEQRVTVTLCRVCKEPIWRGNCRCTASLDSAEHVRGDRPRLARKIADAMERYQDRHGNDEKQDGDWMFVVALSALTAWDSQGTPSGGAE